jgi:hypothetical protein
MLHLKTQGNDKSWCHGGWNYFYVIVVSETPIILIPKDVSTLNPLKGEEFQQLNSRSTTWFMNQGHPMAILPSSSLDQ